MPAATKDAIAAVVGPERTIGCVVGFGATWVEPGKVGLDAAGDLVVGRLDGRMSEAHPNRGGPGGRSAPGMTDERLQRVSDLLGNAFPTRVSTNIRGDLWAKMLVNSMTVLGALGGMLTGDLLLTHERRRFVGRVVAEGVRVAGAEGVELPPVFGVLPPALVDDEERWTAAMERVLVRVGEAFGAIKSVTWRDFELGRPTEIDAVTGEIVGRGQRAGVAVPLSARVYELLREIESGRRRPDPSNLEEVSSLAAETRGGASAR